MVSDLGCEFPVPDSVRDIVAPLRDVVRLGDVMTVLVNDTTKWLFVPVPEIVAVRAA